MYIRQRELFLVFFLCLCNLPCYLSITCYSCEDELSNENCNVAETSCDGSCYTTIKKLESTGKRYYKGCKETEVCDALVSLRNDKYCPFFPSECIYCCIDKDLCNGFNGAPEVTSHTRHMILATTVLGVLFMNLLM